MSYDEGGFLSAGLALVTNDGPAERILTRAEWEDLRDD